MGQNPFPVEMLSKSYSWGNSGLVLVEIFVFGIGALAAGLILKPLLPVDRRQ
jgi:hypothetical protein